MSGQAFNIGADDQNFQQKAVVEMVQRCVPTTILEGTDKLQDRRDYRVSFQKARTVLGFDTSVTVEDGVREIAAALETGVIIDPYAPAYYN